jgi:hypothetical protein
MAEKIVDRVEVDRIFASTKAQWASDIQQFEYPPGWEGRIADHETGAIAIAFDSTTGERVSMQPLFRDESSPPAMLTVISYYRPGSVTLDGDFRSSVEKAAAEDLGEAYQIRVIVSHDQTFDIVELLITKTQAADSSRTH